MVRRLEAGSVMADLDDTDPPQQYTAERLEQETIDLEKERKKRRPDDWSYGQSLSRWLGEEEPSDDDSVDWFMRGIVPRGVPWFVAGDPKTGKTMLVESLSIHLAMGAKEWCGFPITQQARVLLMPREDSERTTRGRIWQLARGAGLKRPHELEDVLSIDPTSPLDMNNVDHCRRLERACSKFDIVIVDSFATAHHGNENDVRDISSVMGAVRDIALGTDTATGFIHHFNGKGAADDRRSPIHKMRGSSAIAGYARHVVGVMKGKEKGQIVIETDGNLQYQPDPFVVKLVGEETDGRRSLRYELVGSAEDAEETAKNAAIDAAILQVLERGPLNDGLLRKLVSETLKEGGKFSRGARGSLVTFRADYLKSQSLVDREIGGQKQWGLL